MTFSTLITTHVREPLHLDTVLHAIQSHQATCDSQLHVWDHDGKVEARNAALFEACADEQAHYRYREDPYHQTKWFNEFRASATTDYVIYSNADVIFHPRWLEEIRAGIAQHPGCLSYHPASVTPGQAGLSYITEARPRAYAITANPLCHVIVSPTQGGHQWDENFPCWEADMDYHLTMERGSRKACICLGSRVDHLNGSVFCNASPPSGHANARRDLEVKWGLEPLR